MHNSKQDELVIHITQNGEIKVENTDNGVISFKKVEPDTFIECIRKSVTTGLISSGLLPKDCISFAQGDGGRRRVCIEYGADNCDITYEKTVYQNFPLPRLVFGFDLKDDKVVGVDLGVTECGRLTPKSKMYKFPFSNVHGFRLCLGTNRLPAIKSLHQFSGIMHFILTMPNNNDHYSPNNTKLNLEYRHLMEVLKDKNQAYYYTDVLKETSHTLKDFINNGG